MKIFLILIFSLASLLIGRVEEVVVEPAPDFKMTTASGKVINLRSFEGKVVYISFWASWCGVCKKNFKAYQSVRKLLEEKGVILLNVSMDKDDEKWRDAMEKNDIDGIHARVDDYDTVQGLYQLYSLPSYEILDKQQLQVYLSDAPGRDIFSDFEKWLGEPARP
jgi:peroxiredoxin